MVEFPWSRGSAEESAGGEEHPDALVVCSFQDGTLVVYEDRVVIERPDRSRFDDKTIPMDEIEGVDLSKGLTIGYLQIEQTGVPTDAGGLFSDPVNENTVHFGRGGRDCATEARTEILSHATG